jgi:hypothetical protein
MSIFFFKVGMSQEEMIVVRKDVVALLAEEAISL